MSVLFVVMCDLTSNGGTGGGAAAPAGNRACPTNIASQLPSRPPVHRRAAPSERSRRFRGVHLRFGCSSRMVWFTTWIRGGRKFERRDEATLRNDIWLDPVTLVALKRRWDGRARAKNRIGGEYGVYICVPDGRLALHGGEAGSKKETCRTHL